MRVINNKLSSKINVFNNKKSPIIGENYTMSSWNQKIIKNYQPSQKRVIILNSSPIKQVG